MTFLHELKSILGQFGLEYFNKYYGCYRGFIESNEDPDFLGRVQLRVPAIFGDEVCENWAWSKGMFAGTGIGLFAIPNKGDAVWVSFEGGDPRFPIWEYGWFGTGDVPATAKNNGNKPTNYVFQSTSGHRIEMDDKNGEEAVRVYSKNGYGMVADKDGVSIIAPSNKKIFIGGLGAAAEPAVLGDKNATALSDIKAMLQSIAQMLATIGAADAAIATTLGLSYAGTMASTGAQMITDIVTLTTDIAATKSTKVKTD